MSGRLWVFVIVLALLGCPSADDDDTNLDDDSSPSDDDSSVGTDADGDGWTIQGGDCDDSDPSVHPEAEEVPFDGIDQDCNGEDSFDGDGDGYDADHAGGDDCDDDDPSVNPGADEVPYDGVDQDCDGADLTDVDEDGYEAPEVGGDDCDDDNPFVYPGAGDICDSVMDNDCDGADDPAEVDDDGDGWSECDGDCNDAVSGVNPDAEETCSGYDDDCDGDLQFGELDADGDGSLLCEGDCDDRDPARSLHDLDGDSYSTCMGDCDDGDATINPSMAEVVNGLDDDCDGEVDTDAVACTWVVPTDYAAIQDAIDASYDGDTVCVEPGSYLENIDFVGKEIAVVGLQGRASTEINGGAAASVVTFEAGEEAGAILRGFTLTNGFGFNGGGIHVSGSSPTLQDLRIRDCFASNKGGGISLQNSSSALARIDLESNESSLDGGGLWLDSSTNVEITSIWLEGNHAGEAGGGMYVEEATVSMSEVDFFENESEGSGGGMAIEYDGAVELRRASFIRNQATGYEAQAGGLFVYYSSTPATLEDLYFDANEGWDGGGAVLLYADGTELRRAVFVNHDIYQALGCLGGGLAIEMSDDVLIDSSLFTDNQSGTSGAFCVHDGDNIVVRNTMIANNLARGAGGGGVRIWSGAEIIFENTSIIANYSNNNGGGIQAGTGVDLVLTNVKLVGNEADQGSGGGISAEYASVAVVNSVIAGNNGSGFSSFYTYSSFINTTIHNNIGYGLAGTHEPVVSYSNVFGNASGNYSISDQTGMDGNISVDPMFLDVTSPDPHDWDLHIDPSSPMVDAGDSTFLDPDGSCSDIGAFGGPGAGLWDLDWDGYPSWWQPGVYDYLTYPGQGWDCDDSDGAVYPGNGC
jgi:hypothetical protein